MGRLLLAAAVLAGIPGAGAMAAQLADGRSVTCESGGHLARSAIWVDPGCRGVFEVSFADGGRRAE